MPSDNHKLTLGDFIPGASAPTSATWPRYFIITNESQTEEWKNLGNFQRSKRLSKSFTLAGISSQNIRWFHRASKDTYLIAKTEEASKNLTTGRCLDVNVMEHPYDNNITGFIFHHDYIDENTKEVQEALQEELDNQESYIVNDIFAFGKRNDHSKCSGRIKLGFRNHALPDKIKIWGHWVYVEPPRALIRQCTNCFRFGHLATKCRRETQACSRCYTSHSAAIECDLKRCLNCGGNHQAMSDECDAPETEKEIHELAVDEGISLAHARIAYQDHQKIGKGVKRIKNVYINEKTNEDIKTLTKTVQDMVQQQTKMMETLNGILGHLNLGSHMKLPIQPDESEDTMETEVTTDQTNITKESEQAHGSNQTNTTVPSHSQMLNKNKRTHSDQSPSPLPIAKKLNTIILAKATENNPKTKQGNWYVNQSQKTQSKS